MIFNSGFRLSHIKSTLLTSCRAGERAPPAGSVLTKYRVSFLYIKSTVTNTTFKKQLKTVLFLAVIKHTLYKWMLELVCFYWISALKLSGSTFTVMFMSDTLHKTNRSTHLIYLTVKAELIWHICISVAHYALCAWSPNVSILMIILNF